MFENNKLEDFTGILSKFFHFLGPAKALHIYWGEEKIGKREKNRETEKRVAYGSSDVTTMVLRAWGESTQLTQVSKGGGN